MTLQVENLSFSYGNTEVLRDVSFSVEPGQLVALLGANGAGKSTLFRCLLGNLRSYTGEVCLDGDNIRRLSPREMARRVAYIPQTHRPTFGYVVQDTVLMGCTRQLSAFQQPGPKQVAIARGAMERVGILHLADRDFARLSGGEQQLTLVARAIAQQAQILVMDEPTSALDYGNQYRVLQQVRELSRQGFTVLLSTHNPQHALQFADGVLALAEGTLVADGMPEQVLTPALIRQLYGMDADILETAHGRVLLPTDPSGERI